MTSGSSGWSFAETLVEACLLHFFTSVCILTGLLVVVEETELLCLDCGETCIGTTGSSFAGCPVPVPAGGSGAFFFLRPRVSVPVSTTLFRVFDGVGGFELPSEAELVDVYRRSTAATPNSDPEAE